MFKRIIDFLKKYEILADEQFGFHSQRGVVETMTELTEFNNSTFYFRM